jgi:hypothetical protein
LARWHSRPANVAVRRACRKSKRARHWWASSWSNGALFGGEARRHSLNGNDPELAVEIGKMDALIEQVTGTAA